jgi:hypothetical protein
MTASGGIHNPGVARNWHLVPWAAVCACAILAAVVLLSTWAGGEGAGSVVHRSQARDRFNAAAGPAVAGPASLRLPRAFPAWRYRSYRPVGSGMFVVALDPRGGGPWIVVFDSHGRPRWWFRPRTPALQAQMLADGTLVSARSFGDGYGIDPRMAEEVHSLSGRSLGLIRAHGTITDGHELQPAPGGGLFLDSYPIQGDVDLHRFGGPRHAAVAFGEVQEVSRSGRLLWRWNSRGHIRLAETGRWWGRNVLHNPHRIGGRRTYDAVHINSVEPWGRRQVIVSARHTDAVFGIDRRTGRVLWKLGGTMTPRSLRVIGDPYAPELFGGQHDARMHPGHLLSVYDDATHRARRPRAAFYRIDLRHRTATFRGQLVDPLVDRSHCCGSVRPFAGGWLVDWGDNPLLTAYNRRGQMTFRLHMATSSYRAVPVPDPARSAIHSGSPAH